MVADFTLVVYTLQLPNSLPPAFKGRALRFSYDLVLNINVALPGPGNRQRTKDITIPVRVWPNVSMASVQQAYDVLHPVIQTTEQASVTERPVQPAAAAAGGQRHTTHEPPKHKVDSLPTYAKRLLETLELDSPIHVPPSPSKAMAPLSPTKASPTAPAARTPSPHVSSTSFGNAPAVTLNSPVNGGLARTSLSVSPTSPSARFLEAAGQQRLRPRATSIVAGDEELVEEAQRCGEAVEILSRHSPKGEMISSCRTGPV
jgi:hypothetical protein